MSLHETRLGRRRLRLWVPDGPAPASGWPLLVLLDADWIWPLDPTPAALDRCAVLLPGHAAADDAQQQRALDYTPPAADGSLWPDPRRPHWRCGGAPAFLAELSGPMYHWAQRTTRLDPVRASLFGHSYGGLFVLHTLIRRTQTFHQLICASPSLWWQEGYLPRQLAQLRDRPPRRAVSLTLLAGDAERWHACPPRADGGRRHGGRPTLPAMRALAEQLQGIAHLDVRLEVLPGLAHGPMLHASARRAIELATQARERPC